MQTKEHNQRQGVLLISSGIIVGILYQIIGMVAYKSISGELLTIIGSLFNVISMGILIYLIIKNEFLDWFKHFSFKWIIIGITALFLTSAFTGAIWSLIAGKLAENSINSVLSWSYVLTSVPFMLIGEEFLSIGILYGAWKKLNWKFWQASLFCSLLFAVWHLSAYDFNLLQCLITIAPSRLVLNYLFKKTDSIWVTIVVHITFDVVSFLPILLK
ncbi:CPBP family intramembrane metalloprotease [Carnobacterium divergens]|uniref:CPBP family intramembrane metalloprotease n=1 Tax=Carnobacterium divergens TaxID=2748 RepID=A0AAW8REZ4_CARDV|nr:type II CAAX endopeptidase family protein [Carnobacterium divergens]MDT1959166.1 CPBP family intramembrane metalloprotease [Carnobacterium divergens]MDT1975054.1 CPBP family intramembrane metalloprotease [Carnobacterium divergens]